MITGAMGVGKSTLGRELVRRLEGRRYRDSDTDIVALCGRSGSVIAAEQGVPRLHEIERSVLIDALESKDPLVVSAAASVVESATVRAALARSAFVVVLDAPLDTVLARQAADASQHRRLMSRGELSILIERRAPILNQIADLSLDARRATADLVDDVVACRESF